MQPLSRAVIALGLAAAGACWMAEAGAHAWEVAQLAMSDRVVEGRVTGRRVLDAPFSDYRHVVAFTYTVGSGRQRAVFFKDLPVEEATYRISPAGATVAVAYWAEDPTRSNLVGNWSGLGKCAGALALGLGLWAPLMLWMMRRLQRLPPLPEGRGPAQRG